ncbi:hypothetical protein Lalb_Chr10g0093531 [Lupinus albus]|uniref:Uncharacterized protein n=1 Tax=Lupinus albus TaxID=3870 RepID=A0A6A4PUB3_LUPAL|nr:hypothetical protein Lalb_Chr10g0093531 [Lupinus albus]
MSSFLFLLFIFTNSHPHNLHFTFNQTLTLTLKLFVKVMYCSLGSKVVPIGSILFFTVFPPFSFQFYV